MNEICGEKKKDIQSWEQRDARNEAEVLIMKSLEANPTGPKSCPSHIHDTI